jgi:hypothetical protein
MYASLVAQLLTLGQYQMRSLVYVRSPFVRFPFIATNGDSHA